MKDNIKLGYEINTANVISIKPSHLIVTGITQLSGKTTTLEALIKRSGLKAVIFKTKIGEKSFTEGTEIAPFFRDRSDYEFVKSLIEAYAKEKLFLEKGTLMRLCKGSVSLIEIKKRVDEELVSGKLRGLKEEIHTRLQHYLENLIPQIQYANLSKTLDIRDGINIMNLERFSEEAQSLIIQSVADEVLKTLKGVIIVIPEAWKFLPQKYNNPCKRVVESFIRQGATNQNFIWIDSMPSYEIIFVKINGLVQPITFEALFNLNGNIEKTEKHDVKTLYDNVQILDSNGHHLKWYEIKKIFRHNYTGKLLSLNTLNGVIDVSPNHPICKYPRYVTEARNLKIGDRLQSRQIERKRIINNTKMFVGTEELAWLLGFYTAEGWIHKKHWCLANKNRRLLEKAKEIISSVFHLSASFTSPRKGVYTLDCGSPQLVEYFKTRCYVSQPYHSNTKTIPTEIMNAPKNIKKAYLYGYLQGDGSFDKERNYWRNITTTSRSLAFGIIEIINVIYGRTTYSLHLRDDKPSVIEIMFNKTKNRLVRDKIKKIIKKKYHGFLYDIEVNSLEHTFYMGIGNIRVHNSQDMAGVDKIPLKQVSTWCLTPDTLIRTNNGWKPIVEIKEGEKVLTHKARFKEITKIMKRKYNGNIKVIKTYGSNRELRITGEHPILCEKIVKHGIKGISNSTATLSNGKRKRYRYENPIKSNPLWTEASEVNRENLFLFSRPKHKKSPVTWISSEFINEIDENIIKIAGWFLAEGFKDGIYNTDFALGHTEQDYALEILNSAKSLGVNGDLNHKKNGIRVRLFSKGLQKFLLKYFGQGAKNKVIPEWIYNLDDNLIRLLLDCYTKGDGHQLKQNKNRFKCSTISEELAFGIRDICILLGYPCSISKQETEHNPKYIIQYDISEKRRNNRQSHGRVGIDDEFMYVRVNKISDENYNGFVYNLEVEEDESYETICGIVHNCLGYQSERNEVKHTLDQISLPKKLKPTEEEIMTLKKGHFFLSCYEGVYSVYVQPSWLSNEDAVKIAKGKLDVDKIEAPDNLIPYSRPTQERGQEKVEIRFDDSRIRKDLIGLRTDFFNKIQELQNFEQKLAEQIYTLKSQTHEINEDELISKILQKIPTFNNTSIDKDSIIKEVLMRVPKSIGNVVYEVAPIEKIKKDFLEEAKQKILSDISTLSNNAKRTLKYLESRGVGCSIAEICVKGFMYKDGGGGYSKIVNDSMKELSGILVGEKQTNGKCFGRLRERIKQLLEVQEAKPEEIEQVYNHILIDMLK